MISLREPIAYLTTSRSLSLRFPWLALLCIACVGPSITHRIVGRSGKSYDSYLIRHSYGIAPGFNDSSARRYLAVGYFTSETDPLRLDHEADDVLPGVVTLLKDSSETAIVIEQAKPVVVRESGLVHGSMVRFIRDSAGNWLRDEGAAGVSKN